MNQALALQILQQLLEQGVSEFCVCPGARNSPLVDLLLKLPQLRRWHFFEERSAAFFALGRIKALGRPVAVLTTSGTAAGELLPATMEAYYCSMPLVLLTADRPRRFRGSGAPQTAEQVGIFGIYAEKTLDLAAGDRWEISWSQDRPLHLNVCFEEPLLDDSAGEALRDFPQPSSKKSVALEDIRTSEIQEFLRASRHPLVIAGSLRPEDRAGVKAFLLQYSAPVYFEAPSGLREDPELAPLRLHCSDGILERARLAGYPIDGVLRLGGVPTLRLWRDLEILNGTIPVCSISREPFSGLSWARSQLGSPSAALRNLQAPTTEGAAALLEKDHALQGEIRALFHREPRSEPALFHFLSRTIPLDSKIFLGNSLPVREWDLAATFSSRGFEIGASRGLNGIDGQASTFYGFSEKGRENWAVLGDLTTLYDLPAPWILSQLEEGVKTSLVVVNNGGGKIFSRMFEPKEFQNPHSLDFSSWAKLWKISYEAWDAVPETEIETRAHRIIELCPDETATARFWKSYGALWKS